jgi:hypothetical protein
LVAERDTEGELLVLERDTEGELLVSERDTEGELLVSERDTEGELLVTERDREGELVVTGREIQRENTVCDGERYRGRTAGGGLVKNEVVSLVLATNQEPAVVCILKLQLKTFLEFTRRHGAFCLVKTVVQSTDALKKCYFVQGVRISTGHCNCVI